MAQNIVETEYKLLKLILEDKTKHLTIKDLKEKTDSSMKHIIVVISNLEKKGFITKRENNDKRFRLLNLTKDGEEALKGLKSYFK